MSANTYEKILKFSKLSGIPTKKVLDLLYYLKQQNPTDNYELITKLGISKTSLNQIQKEYFSWFKPATRQTELNNNGQDAANLFIEKDYQPDEAIYNFLETKTKQILNETNKFYELRPESNRDFDQFHATPETTARRAALMDHLTDIKYKKILFIGDDDLTSLTIASLRYAEEITVVDKDTRILNVIEETAKQNGYKINTIHYDAKNPLPKNMPGHFDVVFTDPPYTPNGISLFVSRAIDALNYKNKSARIYFCYGASDLSKERFLKINEIINEMNLMPRFVFDKFNRYIGADSIGSSSALYVCDVTGTQKPLIKGSFNGNLYTNQ